MIRTPLLWQTIGLSRSSYPFSEYTEPCVPARPGAQSEEGHSSLDIYPCHGWGAKSYNWINGQRQIGFHRFSQVQMMLACFHQAIASSLKKKKKKKTEKLGLEIRHSGDLESVLSPWKNFVTSPVFHFSICPLWVCISSQVFIYSSWECTEDPQRLGVFMWVRSRYEGELSKQNSGFSSFISTKGIYRHWVEYLIQK